MTKLFIICAGDRLGKGTLIQGLCNYYDYKNITIRHCDKPPKGLSPDESLDFQFKTFEQELDLVHHISMMNSKYSYHDNIIIYDRFYLGEYVYAPVFRNANESIIKDKILNLERKYFSNGWLDVRLVMLTADPEFFLKQEDGKSFSQNLEQKTVELKRFDEAFNLTTITNKLSLKVNDRFNDFKPKNEILNQVIKFLE